jgi:SAM-dependent methyltransferase
MTTPKIPDYSDSKRRQNDFYNTPFDVCRVGLKLVEKIIETDKQQSLYDFFKQGDERRFADIGAGTGRWGRMLFHLFPELKSVTKVEGFEYDVNLRPPNDHSYYAYHYGNCLTTLQPYAGIGHFQAIIGNPPFYLFHRNFWNDFIWRCLDVLTDDGYIFWLCPVNTLASEARYEFFWQNNFIRHIEWMPNRISFAPLGHPHCGYTNSTEHMFLVLQKGYKGLPTLGASIDYVNDDEYNGVYKLTDTYWDMRSMGLFEKD